MTDRVRCAYCAHEYPDHEPDCERAASSNLVAPDPVIEEVAMELHRHFIGGTYVRWSCWNDAEAVVALVRNAIPNSAANDGCAHEWESVGQIDRRCKLCGKVESGLEASQGWPSAFKPERSAEEESRLADNLHHATRNRAARFDALTIGELQYLFGALVYASQQPGFPMRASTRDPYLKDEIGATLDRKIEAEEEAVT